MSGLPVFVSGSCVTYQSVTCKEPCDIYFAYNCRKVLHYPYLKG